MKFLLKLIILAALICVGFYLWQNYKLIEEEEQLPEFAETETISYEEAGFSIEKGPEIDLVISVSPVLGSEGTLGYNEENLLSIAESLKNNEYGTDIDWPFEDSKQIWDLGAVNAQNFIVLGRFEVCDVTFEKKLAFINNDYLVEMSLSADKDEIIQSMPEYFTTDEANCGESLIWDYENEGQKHFYEALISGNGSAAATKWISEFNDSINTIKF